MKYTRLIAAAVMSILIAAASCINPFYSEQHKPIYPIPDGFCMITAETAKSPARWAFPSSLGQVRYWATIKTPDGTYLSGNIARPESPNPVYLANKGSGTTVRFLFAAPAQAGVYEITVYAFAESLPDVSAGTAAQYKAKAVKTVPLAAAASNVPLGNLILRGNTDHNAPTGTVNLQLNLAGSSGIQRIDLTVEKDNQPIQPAPFTVTVSSAGAVISQTGSGISPGTYTITMKAYDALSGGQHIFLENPIQTITVLSGCATDTWYGIDGQPLTGALEIIPIDVSAQHTLFVKGAGGVLPNTVNADDSNSGISLASPLASLNAALAKCTENGDYTVYVDGAVEEPHPAATQAEITKTVTVKSLSGYAAVKKADNFNSSLIKIGAGGNLNIENITLDGAECAYTGKGGLIYNEGTLTLKGRTVLQKGKAKHGGAVYNGGTFNISGAAEIIPDPSAQAGKNDVYLETGKHIIITGALTSSGTAAHITPYTAETDGDYTKDITIVKKAASAAALDLTAYEKKFSVTQTTHSEWVLYCTSDKLNTVRGTVFSWKGLKKAVREADAEGKIAIQGELKAEKHDTDTDLWGEIVIDKNLTITGTDKNSDILNANKVAGGKSHHRIFTVNQIGTLTLENLTLTGGGKGISTRLDGAAICSEGNVTVKNCKFVANDAGKNKASRGGAVYIERGSFTITNCEFTENSANTGGAVYVGEDGKCTIGTENGEVTKIYFNDAKNGAGIYVAAKETDGCVINEGTIIGGENDDDCNGADSLGGGIYIAPYAHCTVNAGVTIKKNQAAQGGGIANDEGILNIIGSQEKRVTVSSCTAADGAKDGGGIYIKKGTTTIQYADINRNKADDDGGGIYADTSALQITHTAVLHNQAGSNGAGICAINTEAAASPADIKYTDISDNTITFDDTIKTHKGGGIYLEKNAQILLSACTVKRNKIKYTGSETLPIQQGAGICIADETPGYETLCTLADTEATTDAPAKGTIVAENAFEGITDTSKSLGSGIYVGKNNRLKIHRLAKAESQVTPNTYATADAFNRNDVYLASEADGTAFGTIECECSTAGDSAIAAQITPGKYAAGTQVLKEASGLSGNIAAMHHTFTVTEKTADKQWYIDSTGNLKPGTAGRSYTVNTDGTAIEFTMKYIHAFTNGSLGHNDYSNNNNSYTVSLNAYMIGETEVTQELWQAVMNNNPSWFDNTIPKLGHATDPAPGEIQQKRPVEYVNWYQCVAFCNELTKTLSTMGESECIYYSDKQYRHIYTVEDAGTYSLPYQNIDKKGFRLPTEAEWEWAAKGGQENKWAGTNDANSLHLYSWYTATSNYRTHEVKKKQPNGYGLYDMSGNVYEWCWNIFSNQPEDGLNPTGYSQPATSPSEEAERVIRAGAWGNTIDRVSLAFRLNRKAGAHGFDNNLGLRLVCSP